MKCPKCSNTKLRTTAVTRVETGHHSTKAWYGMNVTRRRRVCPMCNWKDWTVEILERDILPLIGGTAQHSVGGKPI